MARARFSKTWTRLVAAGSVCLAIAWGALALVRVAPAIDEHLARPEGRAGVQGALSPDGRLTAIIRNDGAVEIRRIDGNFVGVVRGHGAPLVDADFTPDGRAVRTVDTSGILRITQISGLNVREAVLGSEPDLRLWFDNRIWDPGGAKVAVAVSNAEWAVAPWSPARRLGDAAAVAPLLPNGVRPPPGTMFRDCDECPEMVVIPAGTFTMGSALGEENRMENEGPQRNIFFQQPFAVGRFEITVQQYRQFTRETGHPVGSDCISRPDQTGSLVKRAEGNWTNPGFPQDPNHPVVCVGWDDAKSFTSWLSQKTGHTYRLLSESEWEYAARAGTATPNWFGGADNLSCGYINAAYVRPNGSNANGRKLDCNGVDLPPATASSFPGFKDVYLTTAPAGSFPANKFGLHDMLGNVLEWTEDCYEDSYSVQPSDGSYYEKAGCAERAIRGGSWLVPPRFVRSAARSGANPDAQIYDMGFRVSRTVTE